MKIRKLRPVRFEFWTLVTILGYFIVFLLLIYPLYNIFKASFIDNETGALSLSNFPRFIIQRQYSTACLYLSEGL